MKIVDAASGRRPHEVRSEGPQSVGHAFATYEALFDAFRHGEVAPAAPIPSEPEAISANLKAGLYFLDADIVGCGVIPDAAWIGQRHDHQHSVIVVVEHARDRGAAQPGEQWISGTRQRNADLRAAELATICASYIRKLGFDAVAHTPTASDLDLDATALQAGVVDVRNGTLRAPYLRNGFAIAAVSTTIGLSPDAPLARRSLAASLRSTHSPGALFGRHGTRARLPRLNGAHRPLHLGRYQMERIKRVDDPTTLILDDEVPRVPKRAAWFERAHRGDLGPKFQKDRKLFALKTPQAQSFGEQIRAMVPHQDGPVAAVRAPGTDDPKRNAESLKALAHYVGGDMVGVCEVPHYAWFSHHADGTPIDPYHRNAIVILLDQGHETMEGASGDDWVSASQSMRAYMRGAQVAGLVAEHIRSLGWPARTHTNLDSDVLHIPLVLQAGLGEMSRIGELVLNPFLGPRFKTVVITTNMPVTPDRPIDFGLQDFCTKCTKCARECPCGAISFGDKVMFNGYEIWKPDVEKCTKYRLGNQKGSSCGRCMKTCPFNTEGVLAERAVLWSAIKLPFTRKWIAHLDDRLGNGSINKVKKWWWDLEWVDGHTVTPARGTNERDLDLDGGRIAGKQKIAVYPASENPPPVPVDLIRKPDRKAAVAFGQSIERPDQARRRRKPNPTSK